MLSMLKSKFALLSQVMLTVAKQLKITRAATNNVSTFKDIFLSSVIKFNVVHN
jgi:hypothetical protein